MKKEKIEPDRRTMRRFDLKLSSELVFKAKTNQVGPLTSRTINICAGGAFFDTPVKCPLGTPVMANIALPRNLRAMGANRFIAIEGKVVRKETHGVAVAFSKRYDLWTQ